MNENKASINYCSILVQSIYNISPMKLTILVSRGYYRQIERLQIQIHIFPNRQLSWFFHGMPVYKRFAGLSRKYWAGKVTHRVSGSEN